MDLSVIFQILILVMSVVVHEVAHGYTALFLGDVTPKVQGRLTLNPIKHLDPIGSVIVPILTHFAGFTFGWAKPVMINPDNFRRHRYGELFVAIAGPLSNIFLAAVFSIVIRLGTTIMPLSQEFLAISTFIIIINLTLAVFNLLPIPPLDGSKVLFAFIPPRYSYVRDAIETHSLVLALIAVFFLWRFIFPVVPWLFGIFVGL